MEQTVFELDLLEEARDFLKSLTKEIRVHNRVGSAVHLTCRTLFNQ